MTKLLALALVAACGGSPKPAPIPPPDPEPATGTTIAAASNDPPPDAADRKHAFAKLPADLEWTGKTAPLGDDVQFERIAPGMSFDVTEGPTVVVQGKVTNVQNRELAYWNQKAHRIQCTKDGECIVFVHARAKADPRELFAKDLQWTQLDPARPDPLVAPLWGDGTKEPNGFLMKMKPGGAPFWHVHRRDYHGVVLVGNVTSYESGTESREMPPGSYWWQPNGNKHTTDCKGPTECVIYLDFTGAFDVKPVP